MENPANPAVTPIGVSESLTEASGSATLVAELFKPETATRAHHRWGPSKFNHIHHCPGFESENTEVTEAAENGTRAHDVMEETIKRYFAQPAPRVIPLTNFLHGVLEETVVDEEDHEYLHRCCAEFQPYAAKATDYRLEIGVTVPRLDGTELSFGYLDALLFFGPTKGLLADWKFGWLPVPHAKENRQGWGYAAGVFRGFPALETLGVMFAQPKLHAFTRHVYRRADVPWMIQELAKDVTTAERVQADRAAHAGLLKVNDACTYCRHKNGCAAGLRTTLEVAKRVPGGLPVTFPSLDAIQTPEQAALIRAALDKVETFIDGVKERTKEIAIANGGQLSATGPSGEPILYQVSYQSADRQLGDTVEIVEGLKDIIDERQLLAAAEFRLGKLEEVVGNAIYENTNLPIEQKLKEIAISLDKEVASGRLTKTAAKKQLTDAKKQLKKITKEEARDQFNSILEVQGLIQRPEGKIPVLRRKRLAKEEKSLAETTETTQQNQ